MQNIDKKSLPFLWRCFTKSRFPCRAAWWRTYWPYESVMQVMYLAKSSPSISSQSAIKRKKIWTTIFSNLVSKYIRILISSCDSMLTCIKVHVIFPSNCPIYQRQITLSIVGYLFLHDWQPPLIFVRFISNFLCMCSKSMASAHVILKFK